MCRAPRRARTARTRARLRSAHKLERGNRGGSAWSLREDELVLRGQAQPVAVVAVADDDFAGTDEQVATVDMTFNDLDRPLFHGSRTPFSCRRIGGVFVGTRAHLADASQYTDVYLTVL